MREKYAMAEKYYGSHLFRQWFSQEDMDRCDAESGKASPVLDDATVSKPGTDAMNLRWVLSKDIPEVSEIETICFEDPHEEDDFYKWLAIPTNGSVLVETEEGEIVGYAFYKIYTSCYEILTIAVLPDYRNMGVGRMLVESLRKKLKPDARRGIVMWVPERNLGAQLFFQRLNFLWARSKQDEDEEDLYLMRYMSHSENF